MESESFFRDVRSHLDVLAAGAGVPFYLSGYPTNEAVLKRLNPADRFLHDVVIGVRNDLPLHLRVDPSHDPFFPDRIISAVESILYEGLQKEVWAF